MTKVILGITGSIAAYKSIELARLLIAANYNLQIILTAAADKFVSTLTLQAIAGCPVYTAEYNTMLHIELARWADQIIIAPASANILAKLAAGICDDLLTAACMVYTGRIVLAPAMNTSMWENLAVQANVTLLRQRNYLFLGPAHGLQACGDNGYGRMVEPETIMDYFTKQVVTETQTNKPARLKILINAGATQEPLDPVRFISNRSSGKMGIALALAASAAGAQITLIAAHLEVAIPSHLEQVIHVTTAAEMLQAVEEAVVSHDIFIACAAITDYRASTISPIKIAKAAEGITLQLQCNKDIVATVAPYIFTVGFAAETHDLLKHAQQKLKKKGLDMIVANNIAQTDIGYMSNDNEVYLITKDSCRKIEKAPKLQIAHQLIQSIINTFNSIH